MSTFTTAGFERFIQAVHGHPPFPWQSRLVTRLLDGEGWPDLLDLPTGSGKTSVLDIAVFTLAASADIGRTHLPRRMVFVVDRRVIVDQTASHAGKLVAALGEPDGEHVGAVGRAAVHDVARALQRLRGDDGSPLHLAILRGGLPRDGSWALRPDQATIMVSTVDQVGSRLLFNGYGVTDRMAAVQAGLLGVDTVYFLDEVHLSRPFSRTLRTVSSIPARFDGPGSPTVVELSATPGEQQKTADAFELDHADWDPNISEELVRRLTAPRYARLVEATGREAPEAVAGAALKALASLEGDTFAVVVNRVATASTVHKRLKQEFPEDLVKLVTGRMRPLDRDRILRDHHDRLHSGRVRLPADKESGRKRLILVATQTIEAGADFDFDGMVTELAPMDSLRQRFGRLDRRGTAAQAGIEPRVVIVAPRVVLKAKEPDPVYGKAAVATFDWLNEQFGSDDFDVSPSNSVLADPPDETLAPSADAPLLLPHHVDLFVQTAPRPATQPPVDLWLHGPTDQGSLDVTVVWRADVVYPTHAGGSGADWASVNKGNQAALELAPPAPGEAMAVRLDQFREWAQKYGTSVLRWGRRTTAEVASVKAGPSAASIRPGDTVIVPTDWGGIEDDNWAPSSTSAVTDLGLDAVLQQRRRVVVRFVPGALPDGVVIPEGLTPDDDTVRERIFGWLDEVGWHGWYAKHGIAPPKLPSTLRLHWIPDRLDSTTAELAVSWWVPSDGAGLDTLAGLSIQGLGDGFDGSDEVHSFTASHVSLESHGRGVGELAALFAERLGLDKQLQSDLRLAGELHDLGKADPRFQRMLLGGWPGSWVRGQEQLAKSPWVEPGDPEARRATERSGYPSGMRHEIASVALVQDVEAIKAAAYDLDLVLHLVATHHGSCRPFAPVVSDTQPLEIRTTYAGQDLSVSSAHGLEDLAAGIPDRFWRVHERYGPWGIAFLETLLRLADHRRSQWEREQAR